MNTIKRIDYKITTWVRVSINDESFKEDKSLKQKILNEINNGLHPVDLPSVFPEVNFNFETMLDCEENLTTEENGYPVIEVYDNENNIILSK